MSMPYPIGRIRGMTACTSPRGTFAVLAVDHRQNLRRNFAPNSPASVPAARLIEFKRAVVGALASYATAVLLDPEYGAAQCIATGSLPGRIGLIVALEATGYGGHPSARTSRVLPGWSVAKAKRMGASAVKLLVHYHPDVPNAASQERLVARIAASCLEHDMPLLLEPLSFSPEPDGTLRGEAKRRVVIETAKRLTALGGDVLKTEFPYDAGVRDQHHWQSACEELSAASRIPWVLLSGGLEEEAFEAQVEVACRAGASGVVAGRAIWHEAAHLAPEARAAFLATTAAERMRRLAALVERSARPWHAVPGAVACPEPPENWYREY